MSDPITQFRQALERSPESHALRLLLAQRLHEAGDEAALTEYETLLDADALPRERIVPAGLLAVDRGAPLLAGRLADAARSRGVIEGLDTLQERVADALNGTSGVPVPVLGEPVDPPSTGSDDLADSRAKKLLHLHNFPFAMLLGLPLPTFLITLIVTLGLVLELTMHGVSTGVAVAIALGFSPLAYLVVRRARKRL